MKANDSECELSAKKRRAIEALLADPTITRASTAAGVSETTMHRWMAEPAFREALEEARAAVFDDAIETLRAGTRAAAETLTRHLNSGHPPDEIRAARTLLELYLRITERQDLEKRIEELEAAIKSRPVNKLRGMR